MLLATLAAAQAHDVITTKITFSREISRSVYKRCASCHHDGGKAPMSLMTYDEARPWAKAIKEEVNERRMPPWGAMKGFGKFQHDNALTQEEITIIAAWVEGGAPEGDVNLLPANKPVFTKSDPVRPPGGSEILISKSSKLAAPAKVLAVRPNGLKDGASFQVIAERPDGSIEPIIWIFKYKKEHARTYFYEAPVSLPAGTKFEMSPPNAGTLTLYSAGHAAAKSTLAKKGD
ncbi:MAG: cytochrome c [Bryobacteraceae bacterium]